MIFCFYKSCSFILFFFFFFFLHFLNFCSFPSNKWIYSPLFELQSHRLGKHLSICFKILLFFLQFAEFKLKAPPYSKTLHYTRISISRALPPFRSIYNVDCGNFSHGKVAIKKCKIPFFYSFFFYMAIPSARGGG